MKSLFTFLILALIVLCLAPILPAQTTTTDVTNLYAAGLSFNSGATPALAGTGLWAHKVADSNTYAFTAVDALPSSVKPFTVTTNFSTGVAQKVLTIGKVPIYIPASAGISFSGTNTGWSWTTGALAAITVKDKWRLCPNVRLVRSNVDGTGDVRPVVGVLFGWGE